MRLKLTAFVLGTKILPWNRHFQGQRYFEDFFLLFFPFLAHQWRWKAISNFRLCKKWNVTFTVYFQSQEYLSEFFQYWKHSWIIINLNSKSMRMNEIFISDQSNVFRYQSKSFAMLCVVMRAEIQSGNRFQWPKATKRSKFGI